MWSHLIGQSFRFTSVCMGRCCFISYYIKTLRYINPFVHVSLQTHSQQEMNKWKIVRVSEDFRVIALGLPIPRYTGNPLDPPLRSRFQARDISSVPFKVSETFGATFLVPSESIDLLYSLSA